MRRTEKDDKKKKQEEGVQVTPSNKYHFDASSIVERVRNNSGIDISTNKYHFDSAPIVEKTTLEKDIGFDTFDRDYNNLNTRISDALDGWQTQETMSNLQNSVAKMDKRLGYLEKYKNKYGLDTEFDTTKAREYYKSASDTLGEMSTYYGDFKTADAYNSALKKYDFDKKYSGKTYAEIQKELASKEEGSDEYNYLKSYTGYSNLNDFDKAIEALKGKQEKAQGDRYQHGVSTQSSMPYAAQPQATADKKMLTEEQKENQKLIADLERARNLYKEKNGVKDYYEEYLNAPDFEEKSQYKSTVRDEKTWGGLWVDKENEAYEYINDVNGSRDKVFEAYKGVYGSNARTTTSYEDNDYDRLTEDEKQLYNYLFATDKELAQQYLDDMQVTLSKRRYDEEVGEWQESSDGVVGGIVSSLTSIPMSVAGGIGSAIGNLVDKIKGVEYNPYANYNMGSNYASVVRENVGQNIAEATDGMEILGTNVPSFLYQTSMSIGDTVVGGATLGKWYSAAAGSNAFQQKAKELKEQGETDATIYKTALASGIAEMAFEYVSLDKLLKIKNVDSAKKLFTESLKQAGIEGSEEMFTEISNIITDEYFRGDNSELSQKREELLAQGYTKEEADKMVRNQIIRQVGEALVGGMVSGIGLGGGQSAINLYGNAKTGSAIKANDRASDMWDASAMTPQESEAFALYTEYANKGKNADTLKNAELGALYTSMESEARETIDSKKTTDEQKADALKNLGALDTVMTKQTDSEKEIKKAQTQAKLRASELNIGEATEISDTGEAIEIKGIKTVDDETVIVTNDGEVALTEATLSGNSAMLVAYAENMSEAKRNMFIANYDDSTDVNQYFKDFTNVYDKSANGFSQDLVLRNRGSLSAEQVSDIYKNTLISATKERQAIINSINEKSSKNFITEGKFDDSVIDYDSKTTDGSKVNWNSLNQRQREAVVFVQGMSKALGINVVLEKEGKVKRYNGWYSASDNSIHIDVHAGIENAFDNDTIIPVFSHELTHWMKSKSPEMYQKMKDFALETIDIATYGSLEGYVESERQRLDKAHAKKDGSSHTSEDAMDEILARTCEDMLANSKTVKEFMGKLSESEQKTFIDKVKQMFKDILAWVDDMLSQYKGQATSQEAKVLRKFQDRFTELSEMWDAALTEAVQTNQSLNEQGTIAEKALRVGLDSLQFNERFAEEHKKKLEEKYVSSASVDLETLMKRYDKILDIWKEIGIELNSKFLENWNNNLGKDRRFTVFKAQAGYKYNVELSSMCKKGVPLFEAIDMIVKKEVMKQLNTKTIGKAEKEILYDILKQHHFEIPCAICYVEQARQREGVIIGAFLDGAKEFNKNGKATKYKLGWNEVLQMVQDEMEANGVKYEFAKVDRSIATDCYEPMSVHMDEYAQEAFYNALKKVANEEIERYNKAEGKSRKLVTNVTPSGIKEVFKGTLPANLKLFKTLFTEPNSRFMIDNDLLYSSETTRNLAMAHKQLYSLFNSQGGVSGYKTKQGTVVYWGDILNKNYAPSTLRKEGGIRNQSNSDFQMYTLLDQVQMYIDFTAKGYYLQAYTKVLSELKLLGLSRGKINASLIPRVEVYYNADGTVDKAKTMENAGLDKNGNPIFDDIEGIRHDEAFMLIEDEEYSKSICGICIGYSDKHILKLLDDSRIQQVIGFHDKTDDGEKRYRGAKYAKNYNGLNEATKKKGGETVHIGFNQFIGNAEKMFKYNKKTEMYEGTIEYDGKTYQAKDIPKLATQLYLDHCEAKGLYPAYSQGGTDFSKHPNYYKLLADFGLYDSKGNYAPHRKVAYNMPNQVPYLDENGEKAYMETEDYIRQELEKELRVRDDIASALADQSEEGIIPQFIHEVNKLHESAQEQYSDRDFFKDGIKVEYSVDEIQEMFNEWNSDEDLDALSKKVFAKFKEIQEEQKKRTWGKVYRLHFARDFYYQGLGYYSVTPRGSFNANEGMITYNFDKIKDISDQEKASVLLHELIHACTVGAIQSAERVIPGNIDTMSIVPKEEWSDGVKGGVALIQIYEQIKNVQGGEMYGQKSVYEMVAELSNPKFRQMLKKQSLWSRLVDAIKRVLGIYTTNALDGTTNALERILELQEDADIRYSDRNMFLDDSDVEEYINAGKRKNRNRRSAYENGEKIIVSNVQELKDFVSKAIRLEITGKTVAYGRVSSDLADKVYAESNGNVDIHGYFLELVADDLYHAFDSHKVAKKPGNLPMSEKDLLGALLRINTAEVENIEYHKDNRTDVKLSLVETNDRTIVVEIVSLSAGSLKFKTGWKEVNKKRNSANSVGNNSSNANLNGLASMRDASASNNIIPQNKENGTEIFADRDIQPYRILDEEYKLAEENKALKEDIKSLKYILQIEREKNFRGSLDESKLKSAAKYLLNKVDSKYDRTAFEDGMRDIFLYVGEAQNLDGDVLMSMCNDLARRVMEKSNSFQRKNVYLERVIADIQKVNIDNIETEWSALSKKYPKLFPSNTEASDMRTELLSTLNSVKETRDMYKDFNKDQARISLAQEIYNQYWNVSTTDLKDKEIQRLRLDHKKQMEFIRDKHNDRMQKQRLADEMHYGKIINKVKSEDKQKLKKIREADAKRQKANSLKADITRKALTLNRWLVKNSKKEHINESMKPVIIKFLNSLDFSSKRYIDTGGQDYTKQDIYFAEALRQVHDMMRESNDGAIGKEGAEYYAMHFSEGDVRNIGTLAKKVEGMVANGRTYVLNQLTLEELQVLDDMVSMLKKSVEYINRFHTIKHNEGVANLGQSAIAEVDKFGQIKQHSGARGWFESMLNFKNRVPHYAFKMFGEWGMKAFDSFKDGWDKFAFNAQQIIEFTNGKTETVNGKKVKKAGAYTDKEVRGWRKEVHTFEHRGKTVNITTSQLMSLYCLSKRDQALKHILQGGVHIGDFKNKGKIVSQNFTVHFTEAELNHLFENELSARQIEVAEKMQEFMNTVCAEWGNEVTMELYGIEQFGREEFYFPIKSDPENLNKDESQVAQENPFFRLLNMSFSKPLEEKAENRIMVLDIFEVFAAHTSDMAKYNALALPVIDTYKLLNYKEKYSTSETEHDTVSLKRSLNKAFGKGATSYIYTFLKDLNGAENTSRDSAGSRFMSYGKIAAVAGNLRVALLQPTAYIKASLVMNPKYLASALAHSPKTINRNYERAMEYCGMVVWKSLGFYDTNISRGLLSQITHDESVKDKAVEMTMKGAEMGDKITLAYLWTACESEIRNERKDLEHGTEEFYKAIGNRLREVIYATQVVDSTMTRSEMMRGSGLYDKMLTAFASEPTLSLNMLQDAFVQYKLTERAEGKKSAIKKHSKTIGRAMSVYTITSVATSIIATAMDIFRDYEDDEKEAEEIFEMFLDNFANDVSIIGKIPYVKEIISLKQGYSASRLDVQWMEQFVKVYEDIKKFSEGKGNAYKLTKDVLKASGSLIGFPFYNIYRDLLAATDKLGVLEAEDLEEMMKEIGQ